MVASLSVATSAEELVEEVEAQPRGVAAHRVDVWAADRDIVGSGGREQLNPA